MCGPQHMENMKIKKWKIMKNITNIENHWFLKISIFWKIFKNHVLASLMCFLSVSRYGDDLGNISNFQCFENSFHQISSKNHQKLIQIAFLELWEYQRMIPHVVFLLRMVSSIFWMDKSGFEVKTCAKMVQTKC